MNTIRCTEICIDASSSRSKFASHAQRFLDAHFADLGLERPDIDGLCAHLWPSGAPGTLIVCNIGRADSEYPRYLLRPVTVGPRSTHFAASGQAPALRAYRRQGRLVVNGFEATPHLPPREDEALVSGRVWWIGADGEPDVYMDGDDLHALSMLPRRRARTDKRLDTWRGYLDWRERLIKSKQLATRYFAWTRRPDSHRVAFLIAPFPSEDVRRAKRTELFAVPLDASSDPSSWTPKRRIPRGASLDTSDRLTRFTKRERERFIREMHQARAGDPATDLSVLPEDLAIIEFDLDEDGFEHVLKRLPDQGFLIDSIRGDLATLENQRKALVRLKDDRSFCPGLAEFLFDAGNAQAPDPDALADAVAEMRSGSGLDADQQAAVARALVAPDLCLIQGPPGTGKTTVIAELCRRLTGRGQRVLVASQSNLAVDNALGRLADTPGIRRLRLGRAERVDPEYQAFLAEFVIDHWFSTVADATAVQLDHGRRFSEEASRRRSAVTALARYRKTHDDAQWGLADAERRRDTARVRVEQAQSRLNDAASVHRRARGWSAAAAADALPAWFDGTGPAPAAADIAGRPLAARLDEALRVALQRAPHAIVEAFTRAAEPLSGITALRAHVRGVDSARSQVARAIQACRGGQAADPDTARRLAEIEAERQRLLDAVDEDDVLRLMALNRERKRLREEGAGQWPSITGDLDRALRALGLHGADGSEICDALEAHPDLLAPLGRLQSDLDSLANAGAHLEAALAALRPELTSLQAEARLEAEAAREAEVRATAARDGTEAELAQAEELFASLDESRRQAEADWRCAWGDAHPADEDIPPPSPDALARSAASLGDWESEQADHLERAARWSDLQRGWIDRLRKPTSADRDSLTQLYVRHANVVGLTCNEAGRWQFFEGPDFEPFDVVIIDEVSKATPPELVMPMLLGRRVVLVGDHRQLPPMFRERESSFEGALETGEVKQEDFERYRKMVTAGLFEELFGQASPDIRATLWTQYRMHPDVMYAVNAFYDDRLRAGPDEATLAARKQHGLDVPDRMGGRLIEPHQHLIWVDTSGQLEEQAGSSKRNPHEVQLVVAAAVRIGEALADRGYGHYRTYDIEREGDNVAAFVDERTRLDSSAITELIADGRIRIDGRLTTPDHVLRAGQRVTVDARRSMGVITFYGAQVKALRQAIDKARGQHQRAFAALEVRTDTVDRFQGMERPIIIASMVRSVPERSHIGAFVRAFQRINVAFSRAQTLLVIIGAVKTFGRARVDLPPVDGGDPRPVDVYRRIIRHAEQLGGYRHAGQLIP